MMRGLLVCSIVALAVSGCSGGGGDGAAEGGTAMNDAATIEATGSPGRVGADGPSEISTPNFVEQAAISDLYEINASKIALEKSQSAEVKSFAQQMIADHSATSAKLKALLPASGVTTPPPAALDARRATLIEQLQQAAPDTFDATYLDQQGQAHREAIGLMDSYATNGDNPALKGFAAETKPKIQMHHDMVSKLDHGGADEGAATGNSGG